MHDPSTIFRSSLLSTESDFNCHSRFCLRAASSPNKSITDCILELPSSVSSSPFSCLLPSLPVPIASSLPGRSSLLTVVSVYSASLVSSLSIHPSLVFVSVCSTSRIEYETHLRRRVPAPAALVASPLRLARRIFASARRGMCADWRLRVQRARSRVRAPASSRLAAQQRGTARYSTYMSFYYLMAARHDMILKSIATSPL